MFARGKLLMRNNYNSTQPISDYLTARLRDALSKSRVANNIYRIPEA